MSVFLLHLIILLAHLTQLFNNLFLNLSVAQARLFWCAAPRALLSCSKRQYFCVLQLLVPFIILHHYLKSIGAEVAMQFLQHSVLNLTVSQWPKPAQTSPNSSLTSLPVNWLLWPHIRYFPLTSIQTLCTLVCNFGWVLNPSKGWVLPSQRVLLSCPPAPPKPAAALPATAPDLWAFTAFGVKSVTMLAVTSRSSCFVEP